MAGFALNRWGDSTLSAARYIHTRLQTVAADPAQAEALFPLNDVPGLKSHLDTPYTLHGHPSGQSIVAAEVTADFNDGYQVTCVLLIFPDKPPFLRACAEGDKVSLPAQ